MAIAHFALDHAFFVIYNLCGSLHKFSTPQHFPSTWDCQKHELFSLQMSIKPGASPHVSSPTFQWLETWRLTSRTMIAKALPGTDAFQRDCLDHFT